VYKYYKKYSVINIVKYDIITRRKRETIPSSQESFFQGLKKKRVELYVYSPSGPSWPALGRKKKFS
jgi:hypothetical protein